MKGRREEVTALEKSKKPDLTIPKFVWASEHQKAFDAVKLALTTAPVLGYPDFEFILETDTSLRGLGAVLSQVDEEGKTHVIAYMSQTLRPSEKSMHNYSSAKLELLALKWAVTEKFRDYLLGLKFTVYTDNNPLAYIQTSKLGVSQICWLSKLALFDFNIIYRLGKSNQATDALSWYPEPNCKLESDSESDDDSDDPVVLSYATICDIIKPVLGDTKIPFTIKKKAQAASNLLAGKKSMPKFHAYPTLLLRPVQSQFLIRCHRPLWPKPNLKILCWDWSVHTYIRGLNQRAWLLPKLDAKQHRNICCNLID